MTDLIVCPSCKKLTRYDAVHTCYDFDAVERVRDAERKVIEAAVAFNEAWYVASVEECGIGPSRLDRCRDYLDDLSDAVRALATGQQGARETDNVVLHDGCDMGRPSRG